MTGKDNNPEAFRAAFREEAREILVDLEASLLELNERPGDAELVGRVFRSLHTIKGSGSMFGFDDLAAFTHNLENAFDEVRKGRLAVTPELVDLALSALDQIRAMVEAQPGEAAADPVLCAKILDRVRGVTGGPGRARGARLAAGSRRQRRGGEEPGPAARGQAARGQAVGAPLADCLRARTGTDAERRRSAAAAAGAAADGRAGGAGAHRDDAPAGGTGPGALLCALGDDADHGGERGRDPGCLHLRRRHMRADDDGGGAHRGEDGRRPAATELPVRGSVVVKALEEQRGGDGAARDGQAGDGRDLRVPAARLDALVDLVGEMVTVQARLSEVAARVEDAEVRAVSEEIERLTSALRENSMTLRMLPMRERSRSSGGWCTIWRAIWARMWS